MSAKVTELNAVCDRVNAELNELEHGLRLRHMALVPIWVFALVFAALLYAEYKRLKAVHVKPLSEAAAGARLESGTSESRTSEANTEHDER